MCLRARQGFPDPTPTLVDIERTHILFVNAHFKPFAALGYEYNKVRTGNGTAQFGGSVQFSIPQFGDFFSDMVVNVNLSAVGTTVGSVPTVPTPVVGSDTYWLGTDGVETATASPQPANLCGIVSGVANATSGVYTKYIQKYVDLAGNPVQVGSQAYNFVRYAEYPGQRLFKKVKFEVNGNPLDEYTSEAVMYYQKFKVGPHKLTGWKRLVGQEVPVDAYTDLLSIASSSNYPSSITNLENLDGQGVLGAPVTAAVSARKLVQVVNGPQTPQLSQPELDLWVPLIFWFNTDHRLAIPSVAIPYGQRYITIDIEQQQNLVFLAPGNLFLELTVEQQTSSDPGTKGTRAAIAVNSVERCTTKTPVLASGSVVSSAQTISNMELYINNIFLNPEIHDIYIKRIGFSLIRVHRFQVDTRSISQDNILLSQLKWPIETIYVGMRPQYNISAVNPNQYRDWHRLTLLVDNTLDVAAGSKNQVMIDNTVAFSASSNLHKYSNTVQSVEKIVFPTYTETIDNLQLQAHGINIFAQYDRQFFRDYLPYSYGGQNVLTPEDPGALLLNFCLYPGSYQPSGHINVSRTREFYLQYVSSYVDTGAPADLLTLARALNFLLISDGSAVLRYST